MPQTCNICRHKKRDEIDRELLAGTPFRHIAARYGTSTSALIRHKTNDIPAALVKAKQVADEIRAESLYDRLREVVRETQKILKEARKAGSHDNDLALKAIARIEKQVELEARLLGELDDAAKVAVGINVEGGTIDPGRDKLSDQQLSELLALLDAAKAKNQPPGQEPKRDQAVMPAEPDPDHDFR